MPNTKYIQLTFAKRKFDLPTSENIPISIDYELEDADNFEQKKGSMSLDIVVPATPNNSDMLNSFFDPNSEDLSPNEFFKSAQDVVLEAGGNEILIGKGFLLSARHAEKPIDFKLNCYGNNGDWMITGKEYTLHDVISEVTHIFEKSVIEASWSFDGTDEVKDFVYAPVRNREPFGEPFGSDTPDTILRPTNMRPSLSLYWLLYRGFKKAGYEIVSNFFDTDYFRRLVLPWTWGSFLYVKSSDLDILKFKALNVDSLYVNAPGNGSGSTTIGTTQNLDQSNDTTLGGFDNANTYIFNTIDGGMEWEYPMAYALFGLLNVGFRLQFGWFFDLSLSSSASIKVNWYVDSGAGWIFQTTSITIMHTAPTLGVYQGGGNEVTNWESPVLNPGDKVKCQFFVNWFDTAAGAVNSIIIGHNVSGQSIDGTTTFQNTYFKKPLGGTVDFKKYDKFKKYKWLDLLRGTIDKFNMSIQTDPLLKKVYIEPTDKYSTDNNLANDVNPGYFNSKRLDWSEKQDLSKISELENYQDNEQLYILKDKDDLNDGILKLIQDRKQINLTQSIYQFPERFSKGTKEMSNRFFSACMHYDATAWKPITGIAPQLICLMPENIANTSNPESEFTFEPKLAYYKGVVDRLVYGGWNWDGDDSQDFPFMFAVNYKPGGETDPILSYCDQLIDPTGLAVVGKGLLKRFFWQRFAVMRHGKRYTTWFNLNNTDILNWLHRENIIINGSTYRLVGIKGYKPILDATTQCVLWRWFPVTEIDNENTFPSNISVTTGVPIINTPDIKYFPLKCLQSDIPIT